LDMEASYNLPLSDINSDWSGDFTFRGLGTYVTTLRSVQGGIVTEGAGVNSGGAGSGLAVSPKFNYKLSATYSNDPISSTLTLRGRSAGTYKNEYVVCSSGCPTSTGIAPTINYNHIAATVYLDYSIAYKFMIGDQSDAEAYVTVENLLNKAPPLAYGGIFYSGQANSTYDRLGRYFHAGVRFRM
jgi:iron complex outermembrane recepter protein